VWIHLPEIEIVRALKVTCEFAIVLLWGEDEWGAASPSTHEFGCSQLLFVVCLTMLPQKVAKCSYMFFHHQVREIATIACKGVGLRPFGTGALFIRIPKKEFAWLQCWARAGHWILADTFNYRLR
jgi:hypothetical protein